MVILEVGFENLPQQLLIEYDHSIQALTSNRTHQPIDVGTLPRRSRRDHLLPDTHALNPLDEGQAVTSLPLGTSCPSTRSATPPAIGTAIIELLSSKRLKLTELAPDCWTAASRQAGETLGWQAPFGTGLAQQRDVGPASGCQTR